MNERLTLQDLIDGLSQKQDIPKKDAELFLRELFGLIEETISSKDYVRIKDFGTFKLVAVSARKSVDVNTGEPIEIPPHYKLSFSPEKSFRELINRPFAHFESVLLDEKTEFQDLEVVTVDNQTNGDEFIDLIDENPDDDLVTEVKNIEETTQEELQTVLVTDSDTTKIHPLEDTTDDKPLELNDFTSNEEVEIEQSNDDNNDIDNSNLVVEDNQSPTEIPDENIQKQSLEEDEDIADFLNENKKSKKGVIIGVCAVLVIIVALALFFLKKTPDQHQNIADNVPVVNTNNSETDGEESTVVEDNNELEDQKEEPVQTSEPIEKEQPKAKPTVKPSQEIVLEKGESLRSLGKKYLGNAAFWVYIYEENSDIIKKPDAIFAGMKLKIPDGAKYGANPNDPKSVERADEKQKELFRKFAK